jgi:hypothetical protein
MMLIAGCTARAVHTCDGWTDNFGGQRRRRTEDDALGVAYNVVFVRMHIDHDEKELLRRAACARWRHRSGVLHTHQLIPN